MALNSVGFETLTITATAGTLQTIPAGAQSFIGFLETADIRVRKDGTAPTTTVGQLVRANSYVILRNQGELQVTSFIRDGATSATLQGHYDDKPITGGHEVLI